MALEDLNIRISADTADFVAGAEGVESQLDDLSGEAIQTAASLEILSNRTDDAGDQIAQTGRRATVTGAQLSGLSGAAQGTNFAFMGLSATTWGSLIPAVVALGAALAPVVGALGGFIAVGAAVAGIGIVGTIGAIAQRGEELKRAFDFLVSTVMEQFAPAFNTASEVLFVLLQEFTQIIPELVPAEDVISRIAGNFVQLGSDIIGMLPALVDLAVTLTTQFLPPFVRWMQDILPQIPGMVENLVGVMDRMIPKFMRAGQLIMDILPPFTEFGFTVLDVLGPALGRLFEEGTALLQWFNQLSPTVQKAGAALSLLAPVIALVGKFLGGALLSGAVAFISTALGPLLTGLGTLASFATTVGASVLAMGGVFANALALVLPFTGVISGLIGTLASVGGMIATILSPILTLVGILGPVGLLGAAVVGIVGLFVMFEDEIRAIISQIVPMVSQAVNDALNWLQTNGPPLAFKAMKALGEVFRAGAIEIYNIFANPGDSVILQAIDDVVDWLVKNGPGLLERAWETLVDVSLAAWRGFKEGLIGNSIIPDTIADVVSFLTGSGLQMIISAASTMAAAILTPYRTVFNALFNLAVGAFNDLVGVVNQGLDVLPDELTSELGFGNLGQLDVERRSVNPGEVFGQTRDQIQNQIQVVVEGELPEESIRQVSVEQEQRRTRERQGRGGAVR